MIYIPFNIILHYITLENLFLSEADVSLPV